MVERSDTFRICERKEAGTPAGVQDFFLHRVPVVSSLALLNHRLQAVMPRASSRSKSVIHGREEYIIALRRPRALPWAILVQAFGLFQIQIRSIPLSLIN